MKFYVCEHCGNIITYAKNSGVPVMCCGQKMVELVPGTTDAAVEKHVPVINQDGRKVVVEVGGVAHPMAAPEEAPKAEFALAEGDKVVAAYAYCNLHGLWKA